MTCHFFTLCKRVTLAFSSPFPPDSLGADIMCLNPGLVSSSCYHLASFLDPTVSVLGFKVVSIHIVPVAFPASISAGILYWLSLSLTLIAILYFYLLSVSIWTFPEDPFVGLLTRSHSDIGFMNRESYKWKDRISRTFPFTEKETEVQIS